LIEFSKESIAAQPNLLRGFAMTFQSPVSVYLSSDVLDPTKCREPIVAQGQNWYYEESPLIISADILYEPGSRYFAGLSYMINIPEKEIPLLHEIIGDLDHA